MGFEIELGGRSALVTGAGQHVGRAIARALGTAGARVWVNDVVPERAARVAEEISKAGGSAEPAVFDVRHFEEAARVVGAAKPDILVNCAGDTGAGDPPGGTRHRWSHFVDSAPAEWDAFLSVNLLGVMHCSHAALPAMLDAGWGRVLTIVSDAARTPERRMAAYAAAKAGAAGFSRALAAEVGASGVTVNCLSLGTIAPSPALPDADAKPPRGYLVPRFGRTEDPAAVAVFLASDHAGWITGQTLPVNGGYSSAL